MRTSSRFTRCGWPPDACGLPSRSSRRCLPARAGRVHEELGWLAGVLGAVRDLDIQLGNLDAWTEELPGVHRQALDELGDLLLRPSRAARAALLEALDSRRYERLVAALTSMLDQGPIRRASVVRVGALEALPELIGGRHREAEKAVRRAHRTGVVEDFHRLRIRCKRLRYAIEFTGDLYGADVKRYARQVASLQDELGLIQDAETAANRLQVIALGEEGALLPRATVFAMGMVSQRCTAEALTRLAKLPAAKQLVNGKLWEKARETMERRREEAARAAEEAERAKRAAAAQASEPLIAPGRARPALPTSRCPLRRGGPGRPGGRATSDVDDRQGGRRGGDDRQGGRRDGDDRQDAEGEPDSGDRQEVRRGRTGRPRRVRAAAPPTDENSDAKTVTPIRRRLAPG